jgi:hypothetical protein
MNHHSLDVSKACKPSVGSHRRATATHANSEQPRIDQAIRALGRRSGLAQSDGMDSVRGGPVGVKDV